MLVQVYAYTAASIRLRSRKCQTSQVPLSNLPSQALRSPYILKNQFYLLAGKNLLGRTVARIQQSLI